MPPSQFIATVETVLAAADGSGLGRLQTELVALSNGNVIVAWTDSDFGPAGTFNRIAMKLLDPGGNVLRSPTIEPNLTHSAEIAATADGGFIVTWTHQSTIPAHSTLPGDVYVARYDASGVRIGDAILVNDVVDVHFQSNVAQTQPAVAVLSAGGFVVLYTEGGDIKLQRFDATGTKLGSATTANATTANDQSNATVTALADGGFVVSWQTGPSSDSSVSGRKFDAAGAPVGSDFTIALGTSTAQSGAEVAPLASGGFVVVWTAGGDVRAQRFDAAAGELGGEFDIATNLTGVQEMPHVAAYPGGGFVAVWRDASSGSNQIIARVFADDGTPVTGEFVVNSAASANESLPEVAVRTDGSLEFVWTQLGSITTQVHSRIFVPGDEVGDLTGTALNDVLVGDGEANSLSGLGGNDTLNGGDGDDTLIGGTGADTLNGQGGSDTASYAGSGAAVAVDLQNGTSSGGDAQLDTLASIENLTGSAFNDVLTGTDGANRLDGGGGDDMLQGRLGADALIGGSGTDTALYADAIGTVFVNLTLGQGFNNSAHDDSYDGIENVNGSNFNDVLIGDEGVNRLDGLLGNDTLIGALGADVLVGGTGTDTASYEDAIGTVFVNLTLGQGFNNSAHGDTYSGIENVTGSRYNDVLIGDAGINRLDGWDGDDTLIGAGGADVLIGGLGTDTASYEDSQASVFVNLNTGQGFGNNAQGDTYSGIENATGTVLADVLIGTTGVNALNGNDGDDVLIGNLAGDTLNGGNGADTASYEDNWGAVFINLNIGQGFGNAAEGDVYNSVENATGSAYSDTLLGSAGANRLNGGSGNDTLVGHGGADQLVFDSALSAASNLDTILDFAPGEDKILLDNAVFAGLSEGALAPNVFIVGPQATGGSNRIVYDQASGALYYDPDGFGTDPAIQFATLSNKPVLTSADFLVI